MRRAVLLLPLLAACREDLEEYEWGQGAPYVPLADLARDGCITHPPEDQPHTGPDQGLFDKPRPVVWRGVGGGFGTFNTFNPTEPDGDVPAVVNAPVWAFWADTAGLGLQRFVNGTPGTSGPIGPGGLGLVCNGVDISYLVLFGVTGPKPLHESTAWYGTIPSTFGGSCDGTTSIGPDGASLGVMVDWAAGTALQITPIPNAPVTTELAEPLPDVVATDVVWVERLGDGRIGAVTLATDGLGSAALAWRTVDDNLTTSVDGEPLPNPVWRGADGAFRVATTYAVYRWEPGSDAELIEVVPSVPVDAAWSPTAGAGALVAVEVVPNELEPTLDVPVAAAVAVAHDGGWAVQEVPTTPCADGDACRNYGETRIAGVAGPATDPILLYDVWRWDSIETHETFVCPP